MFFAFFRSKYVALGGPFSIFCLGRDTVITGHMTYIWSLCSISIPILMVCQVISSELQLFLDLNHALINMPLKEREV